jgi:2-iminobutanoate/2-iminopropanoate deaminase
VRRTVLVSIGLSLAAASVACAPALKTRERHVFNPPGAPTNLPFSNGMQVGNQLWVAGTEGVVTGDIDAETRTALENIKKVLDAAGFEVGDVVQVTVYLKDINDFQRMNAVYGAFFPDPKPTRTTVQVARLVNDARIEITAVAVHHRETKGGTS